MWGVRLYTASHGRYARRPEGQNSAAKGGHNISAGIHYAKQRKRQDCNHRRGSANQQGRTPSIVQQYVSRVHVVSFRRWNCGLEAPTQRKMEVDAVGEKLIFDFRVGHPGRQHHPSSCSTGSKSTCPTLCLTFSN